MIASLRSGVSPGTSHEGQITNNDIENMVNDLLMDNFLDNDGSDEVKETSSLDDVLKFGRKEPITSPFMDPAPYLNISEAGLPLKLTVDGLPDISRVENQLNLKLTLVSNGTSESQDLLSQKTLVHLPSDSIAKEKFYLEKDVIATFPIEVKDNLLVLDAFLICATNNKSTYVCNRCVKREVRRASRRKSGLNDNILWCNNPNRRAIIFKNKQVFSINRSDAQIDFELCTRIVCYCRHHTANEGFKILFIIKDTNNNVVAKTFTNSIVIVDKKLNAQASPSNTQVENDSGLESSSISVNSASLAEVFSSNQLFLASPQINDISQSMTTETNLSPQSMIKQNSTTILGAAFPFPSPSSMSEDSQSGAGQRKRLRENVGGSSSSNNYNSDTSYSNLNSNFSFNNVTNHLANTFQNNNNNMNVTVDPNAPLIQKIIPGQGSINGGIEITLLGKNFKPGQIIMFGDNIALSTQCWNDFTTVTYLPPASSAGQVVVTVKNKSSESNLNIAQLQSQAQNFLNPNAIFTYVDDTDRQLIELALQIVGLKMNGKLEDARNIAKRIVGTNNSSNHSSGNSTPSDQGQYNSYQNSCSDEMLIMNVIKSFRIGSKNLNLSICDNSGRTLLHYAALKSYYKLTKTLVAYGAHVENTDNFGFSPFHFACISGDLHIIDLFYRGCNINTSLETFNGMNGESLLWRHHRIKWDTVYPPEYIEDDNISTNSLSTGSLLINPNSLSNNTTSKTKITKTVDVDSDYDDFADDENESSLEAFTEQNISQTKTSLEEHEDHQTSLWNRVMNRFNDDLLPKYDDLFPKNFLDLNSKATAFMHPEHNSKQMGTFNANISEYEESEQEEDDDEALLNGFHLFFRQQRKNFQNDNMLLFFWIPLMVILLCWIAIYTLGRNDNMVQNTSDSISNYLRIGLTKVVLGNARMKSSFKNQLSNFQSPTRLMGELRG